MACAHRLTNRARTYHDWWHQLCAFHHVAVPLFCSVLTSSTQLPESPRWLAKHGRNVEALAVISALDGKPHTDPGVRQTYNGIREAVAAEAHIGDDSSALREVFTGGRSQNFRRAFLGVVVQCFQQITGINIITYYAVRAQPSGMHAVVFSKQEVC